MKNKIHFACNLFNYNLKGFIKTNLTHTDGSYDVYFGNTLIKGDK